MLTLFFSVYSLNCNVDTTFSDENDVVVTQVGFGDECRGVRRAFEASVKLRV
jgi:hypothetical protein